MDRRGCPSYGVGFDSCDPLGSVLEWSGRGERAARVLRRRCRSEGVERSPYDDALRPCEPDTYYRAPHRFLANKSHFTLNGRVNSPVERFDNECALPPAENGDYLMAHEQNRYHYQQARKHTRLSPTRPLLVTTLSNTKVEESRLPKVEELLEKVDQVMVEVPVKQPLKSILNNPIPKTAPPGILKKPKSRYQDSKACIEGRRRQRASSESDNLFCSFHVGSPIPGYDARLNYLSCNTKRAKDNSGTGYSYGSAIASFTTAPAPKSASNYQKPSRCNCKDQVLITGKEDYEMHVLRTSAINSETTKLPEMVNIPVMSAEPIADMPRLDVPTCPVVSPALPVSSVTAVPPKKHPKQAKKRSKKAKVARMKSKTDSCTLEGDVEESHSRSPSPDNMETSWQMETDAFIAEIDKIEKSAPTAHSNGRKEDESCLTKLSAKLTNGAVVTPKKTPPREESPLTIPDNLTSCLRPSLFPRVPPYLKFVGHTETGAQALRIPNSIQKHLKWKLTTITPIVVKKTLTNSGFRLVKSECDTSECPQEETVEWIGIWGKHMKSLMFRAIKDGQKMNHFPGTFQIGRKDRLWRNLQKLAGKHGMQEFGIMPRTYVLPHDLKILKHDWEKHAANNEKWIIKPPASARGTGIKVVSRWTQIPKKRPVVVQRYVSKPYLINGNKFDMRLYVLVTSIHPLRIYLHRDGLARFASVKYNEEITSLNDRYMHLTNYSINRLSKNYTPNEDFSSCEGHKWTLQTLFQYLKTEKEVDTDALWDSMKDLVIKTIIAGEASISSLTKANITSRYNCYELFGIDVLLDEDLKPWLLEVNISPSLHSASPLDTHVKGPLVKSVLNIAQYQMPSSVDTRSNNSQTKLDGLPYDSRLYTVYLSKEERDKHIIYTNMEDRDMYLRDILSTLTSDDVRHLIQAEDELTQSADMERIFPTSDTHKYLNFLSGPRYYNRLFDAWETRYAARRDPGVELLRNLCDIGYHLEVPPVPLKRAARLSALDRCRMTSTPLPRPPPSARRSCHWRSSRLRLRRRTPSLLRRAATTSPPRCSRPPSNPAPSDQSQPPAVTPSPARPIGDLQC